MFATILILASFGSEPEFVPAPEFLERWTTMSTDTPADRLEREKVRKQWVQAIKRERSKEVALARRQRVAAKNSSGYYFWRQHQNNSEVAAGLNALQPRGYWIIP